MTFDEFFVKHRQPPMPLDEGQLKETKRLVAEKGAPDGQAHGFLMDVFDFYEANPDGRMQVLRYIHGPR